MEDLGKHSNHSSSLEARAMEDLGNHSNHSSSLEARAMEVSGKYSLHSSSKAREMEWGLVQSMHGLTTGHSSSRGNDQHKAATSR